MLFKLYSHNNPNVIKHTMDDQDLMDALMEEDLTIFDKDAADDAEKEGADDIDSFTYGSLDAPNDLEHMQIGRRMLIIKDSEDIRYQVVRVR
jgi:hypothetical protein